MCVCMCVCLQTCVRVSVCLCMCKIRSVCMCVFGRVDCMIYSNIYTKKHIYNLRTICNLHMQACSVSMCLSWRVGQCTIYIYIYTYVHTYIHVHTDDTNTNIYTAYIYTDMFTNCSLHRHIHSVRGCLCVWVSV